MNKRTRTGLMIFIGLGLLMAGLWGRTPTYFLEMGFTPTQAEASAKFAWLFIIFVSFYGYLSILLLFGWLVFEVIAKPVRRSGTAKRIFREYFEEGRTRVAYDVFRKLTGLTDDEMLRLYDEKKSDFNHEDYLAAGRYLKTIGIILEDRGMLKPFDPASKDKEPV